MFLVVCLYGALLQVSLITKSFQDFLDIVVQEILLNMKKSFDLPGIPICSFMFVDHDNWFSKFRETDKQTWTYNTNITYNKTNKNFTYINNNELCI